MDLSDLTLVNTLGEGGFSKVHLVRRNSNSRLYALKVLEKQMFAKKDQRKHIIAERDILLSCANPHIVRLYRTFRDSERLYMLMEFCTGNELWALIHKNRWLNESTAKHYCADVLDALDYLHQRWIAHRDLKPENVIIDMNETPKLIDFGFAKKLKPQSKTYSFLGTPQYVAPEIILQKGHDMAVDLWAVGILIYEMLTGAPPFVYQNDEDIYEATLRGFDDKNVIWPSRLSPEVVDLIQKLCVQDPSERIGYNDIQEVREHEWFKDLNLKRPQRSKSVPQVIFATLLNID
uniref:Protein kinase domain-containing protein n=1 Tax=Syphacia muris TaxID=451379 RepID=A0A0N5AVR7_9BILA